ncbi:MAG: metallophosphoesterase [Thermomicrobiales bacterium]
MRILVLSDVHGNLPALETVLQQQLSFDRIWNLGDTVGYGPWPNECVALLRSYPGSVHLAGNHDLAATGQIPTSGFNPVAAAAATWTGRHLTDMNQVWLRGLDSIRVEGDVTLAHGSPRDPAMEYILTAAQAASMFPWFSTRTCFVGHTHRPMVAVDGISVNVEHPFTPRDKQSFDVSTMRALLNPGSVGQPRDGDSRAAFAVYDTEFARVTFHRVEYPIEITREAILDAGLPRSLGDRLLRGL